MKIHNSSAITPFGGLNFVIKEAIDLNINTLLSSNLPRLPQQCKYNWFDILMSYWSVFFCGGDCTEDLSINLKNGLNNNPYINIPSPDRVLGVGMIGKHVVYVENRNGNSSAHVMQHEIPMRIFSHQPKMNIWVFHQTIKNKIYTDETLMSESSQKPMYIGLRVPYDK